MKRSNPVFHIHSIIIYARTHASGQTKLVRVKLQRGQVTNSEALLIPVGLGTFLQYVIRHVVNFK